MYDKEAAIDPSKVQPAGRSTADSTATATKRGIKDHATTSAGAEAICRNVAHRRDG